MKKMIAALGMVFVVGACGSADSTAVPCSYYDEDKDGVYDGYLAGSYSMPGVVHAECRLSSEVWDKCPRVPGPAKTFGCPLAEDGMPCAVPGLWSGPTDGVSQPPPGLSYEGYAWPGYIYCDPLLEDHMKPFSLSTGSYPTRGIWRSGIEGVTERDMYVEARPVAGPVEVVWQFVSGATGKATTNTETLRFVFSSQGPRLKDLTIRGAQKATVGLGLGRVSRVTEEVFYTTLFCPVETMVTGDIVCTFP